MEKTFYIGSCPICNEYGRLEIDRDTTSGQCIIICEECLAEWQNPEDALKNINGKRQVCKANVLRSATLEEIKEIGWEKFI